MVRGEATITEPHCVCADGEAYRAERIVVATGGWPFVPDIPGAELGITSNEVFSLAERPQRVLIVGGGYIAVEFAGIFHGLVQTVQVYRGPQFLRGFDSDISKGLSVAMKERGDLRRYGCYSVGAGVGGYSRAS